MLPARVAADVREIALDLAQQAAEQFLVSATLLREDIAPPADRRDMAAWEDRQRLRRAEMRLASVELLRYLQLADHAVGATREGRPS